MKKLIVLAILVLGSRLAAAGSPDATVATLSKLLERFAVSSSTIGVKVKNPCLCKATSVSIPTIGVLVYQTPTPPIIDTFTAICAIPTFDGSGNNMGSYSTCAGEFEILAK
jgi:hypothetical protein